MALAQLGVQVVQTGTSVEVGGIPRLPVLGSQRSACGFYVVGDLGGPSACDLAECDSRSQNLHGVDDSTRAERQASRREVVGTVIVSCNGAASGLGEVYGLSLAKMRVRRSTPFVEPNLDAVHRSEITFLRLGCSTEPRSRQDVRTMRFPGAFRGGNLVLYRFSPAWLWVVIMLCTQYVQSVNGSKVTQRHRVVQHR